MGLTTGTRLGPYEILSALGAGGMGEVYRAIDTSLGRHVAIKVLPEAFAQDAERLARFEREAKTLAALNHPHIAQIYGVERSSGVQALVMELVEGEDLSQRIARGPIPLDEALPIARQICEALEAAHDQSIIHRDLKPANIKVTPDGVVKVLDFGLAKLNDPNVSNGSNGLSLSPTITSPAIMTGVGMILGTAAYMAPEQVKGRSADKRSDVWAFGCVLFEMLTGTRAFDGEDVAEVLSRVLQREPEWEALSSDVPPSIRTLLQACLVKDRRKRVADIAAALFVLDHQTGLTAVGTVSAAPLPRTPLWRRAAALTAAALVIVTVATTLTWFATRPAEPVPPRVSRLQVASSGAAVLTIRGADRDLAITPDGSRVVYVGNNGTQLFVRALDALEPVAVFTGLPRGPFVSPDGQWIGFVDGIAALKRVAVTGGPAVTLATLDGNTARGATWAPDDTIIVATSNATTGLLRVAAAGGPTAVLTRPDRAQGEADHLWPELLPGGRAVLFTITALTGGFDAAQVAVLDLQTGTRKILVRGGSDPHYVPSGHIVYAAAGTLRAVPFDLATLETRGRPAPVIPEVVTTLFGAVDAVVAGDGTLAYVSGGGRLQATGASAPRTLVSVDRQGHETPIPMPPRSYLSPRLSPDGTHIAVSAQDQDLDLWLWDLVRATLTRLTFDPGSDDYPVWTADGRRLIFNSDRGGTRNLYWQAADGTGAIERLTDSPNVQYPTAVSPDGRRLIFTEVAPKTGEDIMQVELDGTHRVTPLVQSPFVERNGIVSPDGRWLAYEANDSGRSEIYVRPFPDVNGGHWQVSANGGWRPLWARSGQELFYASPTGALMRVGVERASSWAATTPTLLVKEGYYTNPGYSLGRQYDISPDGQRFVMIKEGGSGQTAAPPQIIVVQHWTEELTRLVPTK
jgi:serine/threonine-protein kinase